MDAFVAWVAPIAATLVTLAGQLWLNGKFKRADEKRDAARAKTEAKRAAEDAWRAEVDKRLSDIEEKMDRTILQQAMQIRSDIVHKCHRYFDDLHAASIEEKDVLSDQHKQYSKFCKDLGIDNDFIDNLVAKVMELPDREM